MDNRAQQLAERIVSNATRSLWVLDYETSPAREVSDSGCMQFTPYMANQMENSLQELISEALKIKEQIRTGCRVNYKGERIS